MGSDYDDNEYALGQEELEVIEGVLEDDMVASGVQCALLIDMAGNIIAKGESGASEHDLYSLAALSSANYAAVDTMAKIIGENEFSLLFHKGDKNNIHFSKVNEEFLLIIIFGQDVSLGLLRLKVAEAIKKINSVWE